MDFKDKEQQEYKIVEQVYKAVLDHRLPPGMKLGEADMCDTFQCGRTTIRRALLLLSSQGIVELRSNRGAFIAKPGPKEAEDVFNTRLILEIGVVKQLTEHISKPHLKILKEHLNKEQKARNSSNYHDFIRLSGDFHVLLAGATGNKILSKFIQELVTRTSLIIGLYGAAGHPTCPKHEHSQILTAIENQNLRKSINLIEKHSKHIRSDLSFSAFKQSHSKLSELIN